MVCLPKKITDLDRFCNQMKDGDIVILRLGKKDIYGVGIIVGTYGWNSIFSDVDGWDLQHYRRVKWLWKGINPNTPHTFPPNTLKWGDTTQEITSPVIINWVKGLGLNFNNVSGFVNLPSDIDEKTTIEQITDYLFAKGMSGNSIRDLVDVIGDLQRIAKWYKKLPAPSEFETEAYLVIPLLRALGWTPQKMAIEWNRVDIALFDKLPREDNTLIAVVEAKRKDNSCLTAFSQAQQYSINKSQCNRLIVTDGLRYGIFIKQGNSYIRHAYMNLTEFKKRYEIYDCKGIDEALWSMTPDWQ